MSGTEGRDQHVFSVISHQGSSSWWGGVWAQSRLGYAEITDNHSLFLTHATCPPQVHWGSSPHYQHPHAGTQGHTAVTQVAWQREHRVWLSMN